MKSKEKSNTKRRLSKILIIIAVVLLLILCAAGILFRDELTIISSIKKGDSKLPFYTMEVKGDYHFEDFLSSGGASSDAEVSAFLTNKISHGFYSVDVTNKGLACSTISARTADGAHFWGRNYDWTGSVPIIVKCVPKDGYASISTCDFQNITGNTDTVPEGVANKMLSIAALYVPMDGINSAGLCVADLEVNEGGMPNPFTDKTDLTITTAIRLLLNKAATVDEAVALLRQYDIHSSGGISHHLAISDATGASVAVEFAGDGIVVVDTNFVTNFNLANNDTAAGGESAKERYEMLHDIYNENSGVLTGEQVKTALSKVSKSEGEWTTQWSIVYEQSSLTANYYFNGDYSKAFSFKINDK